MKKLFLLIISLIITVKAYSQTQIGLKVAPAISFNRVDESSEGLSANTNGTEFKLRFGPFVDLELKENYYFNTGLLFVSKKVGLALTDQLTNETYDETYAVHYLQIPVTLKLYTEEVGLDQKLYFQIGGTADIKTHVNQPEENVLIEKFRFADITALLGAGYEYSFGLQTRFFAGIMYQRGLLNVVQEALTEESFSIKNDLIALEFGIKF
jgi:hypothetical protein